MRGRTEVPKPNAIGYLLDLDGTVYRSDRLIQGAAFAIEELRRRGRQIAFMTNKPLHSREDYARKLTRLGIPTSEDDVITSSYVLATYLSVQAPNAKVFALGEPPLLSELTAAGLELCDEPERVDYVVAAFDRTFDYEKLNIGFQAIRLGARFIATNPDRTCPVDGGEIPDAAGVIAALEATTGRKPEEILGKPSRRMIQAGLDQLGVPPQLCIVVGDRLETDIVMAKESGLIAILTLTGVTTRESLGHSSVRPDFVIATMEELPDVDKEMEKHIGVHVTKRKRDTG